MGKLIRQWEPCIIIQNSDSTLSVKSYNGNAYLFMLDNDGNITYTNQKEDKYFRNYSLLKHLKVEQAITEEEG